MMHGADPWWDVAIRLMIKYANLRLMTSAWSPRHLPRVAAALHVDPRQGPGDVRVRLAGALDHAVRHRSGRTRSPARGPRRLPVPERAGLLLQRRCRRDGSTPSSTSEATPWTRANMTRVSASSATPTAHVARLTIDNPERRNAYDPADASRTMAAYLDELAVDDDIKVVILRGASGVFSTGADMAQLLHWYGADGEKRRPSQRRRLSVDRESFGFYHELPDVPEGHHRAGRDVRARRRVRARADVRHRGGGPRRQARHARCATARPRARQPPPLLLPPRARCCRGGCCSPATPSPPVSSSTSGSSPTCATPTRSPSATEAWAQKVARMPADGLAIAKTSFSLVEQTMAYAGEEATGYLVARVRDQPPLRGRRVQLRQGAVEGRHERGVPGSATQHFETDDLP